jgi:hypothetical protein
MENQKPLKKKRRRPRKVKEEVKPEIKETFTFSCKCSRHHESESDCNAEQTEVPPRDHSQVRSIPKFCQCSSADEISRVLAFSETITIFVGEELQTFSLHKQILALHSDYFRKRFRIIGPQGHLRSQSPSNLLRLVGAQRYHIE